MAKVTIVKLSISHDISIGLYDMLFFAHALSIECLFIDAKFLRFISIKSLFQVSLQITNKVRMAWLCL